MNRDKSPDRLETIKYDKSKMTPTPTQYKVEKVDLNSVLSTRQKVVAYKMGKSD
jgi:hypothetical protein